MEGAGDGKKVWWYAGVVSTGGVREVGGVDKVGRCVGSVGR